MTINNLNWARILCLAISLPTDLIFIIKYASHIQPEGYKDVLIKKLIKERKSVQKNVQ